MVKITRNNVVITVSKSAYLTTFQPQGWNVVNTDIKTNVCKWQPVDNNKQKEKQTKKDFVEYLKTLKKSELIEFGKERKFRVNPADSKSDILNQILDNYDCR